MDKSLLDGNFTLKENDKAVCNHCGKVLRYHRSYTSLKYHVRSKHPFVPIRESRHVRNRHHTVINSNLNGTASNSCNVNNFNKQSKSQLHKLMLNSKLKYESSFSDYPSHLLPPTLIQPHSTSPTLPSQTLDPGKQLAITDALVRWIERDCRPVSIVRDPGLLELLRIATCDASFTLPSIHTIQQCINQPAKLLSEEEYQQQTAFQTRKSLEELKDHCHSAGCNAWRTIKRLHSPTKFASWVDGSQDHLGDSEYSHHEALYDDEDEDDNGGGADDDGGDIGCDGNDGRVDGGYNYSDNITDVMNHYNGSISYNARSEFNNHNDDDNNNNINNNNNKHTALDKSLSTHTNIDTEASQDDNYMI